MVPQARSRFLLARNVPTQKSGPLPKVGAVKSRPDSMPEGTLQDAGLAEKFLKKVRFYALTSIIPWTRLNELPFALARERRRTEIPRFLSTPEAKLS
jgi:hypothetical protein